MSEHCETWADVSWVWPVIVMAHLHWHRRHRDTYSPLCIELQNALYAICRTSNKCVFYNMASTSIGVFDWNEVFWRHRKYPKDDWVPWFKNTFTDNNFWSNVPNSFDFSVNWRNNSLVSMYRISKWIVSVLSRYLL